MFKIKKIKQKQPNFQNLKAEKLEQTANRLYTTRHILRFDVPVGFKPRSSSSYYSFYNYKR